MTLKIIVLIYIHIVSRKLLHIYLNILKFALMKNKNYLILKSLFWYLNCLQ